MSIRARYVCPACGFAIFNRRLTQCEKCHTPLPPELRYNAQDLSRLAADHERNEQTRRELARERERLEAERIRRRGDGG